jgi:hypothetical protein
MRTIILLFSLVVFGSVHAQTQLANDQNPNYLVSQAKVFAVERFDASLHECNRAKYLQSIRLVRS